MNNTDTSTQISLSNKTFIINKKYFINPGTNEIEDISAGVPGKNTVSVEPRIMNLLVLLASGKGEVFSREYLIEKIWGNTFVGEEGLTQAVSRLRKILNDNAKDSQIIQTIPKKGYRLTAGIEEISSENSGLRTTKSENTFLKKNHIILISAFIFSIVIIYFLSEEFFSDNYNISPSDLLNAKPVTSESGLEMYPSISPDGSAVVFSLMKEGENNFNLYIKSLLTNELKQFVVDSAHNVFPVWSPDGKFISYVKLNNGNSDIFIKSVGGKGENEIVKCAIESYPTMCWLDNKTIIYSDKSGNDSGKRNYKLFLKNIETGEVHNLTSPSQQFLGDVNPIVSPDKKTIFFKRMTNNNFGNIYSLNLKNKIEKKITAQGKNIISLAIVNNGNNIIYSGGDGNFSSLFLISLKEGSEKLIGGENITGLSVSQDGKKIIYSKGEYNIDVWIKNLNDNLPEKKILKSTKSEWFPKISPDGKRIVFISNLSGNSEIWSSNINGDSLIQLTHNLDGRINYPSWSPDGKFIAFSIFKNNINQIYSVSSGGGIPQKIFSDKHNNLFPVYSNSGKSIYFRSDRENSDEIWNYNFDDKSFKKITFDNGKYGQENDEGYFYYTRENLQYLWKKEITGNNSELFLNHVHREDFNNWKFIENNIYYFERSGSSSSIFVYNTKTKKEAELYNYNEEVKAFNMKFDISGDEKILCFTSLERLEVDLFLIETK